MEVFHERLVWMYIIYCKHIFVYIFPCCFNWDSSFVTDVFPRKKKKTKDKESPANWGTLFKLLQWTTWRRTLSDLHWKPRTEKGRKPCYLSSQLWAKRAKRRTSTPWLVEFQNGSERTNQKARGWISFPSLITGPSGENWRVQSGTVRRMKPRWTEEMTMWRVSQTAAAGSQRPVSWHKAFSFLTYCTDWDPVHIKPETFKPHPFLFVPHQHWTFLSKISI